MFGLTPRSQKNKSLPPQQQRPENLKPFDEASAREEQRLAEALKKVLETKPMTHRQSRIGPSVPVQANRVDITTPDHQDPKLKALSGTPSGVDIIDKDGPGFEWASANPDEDETQSTSKISKRWLKRARRESRLASLRRGTQWILLVCALCAAIAVTFWPSTS